MGDYRRAGSGGAIYASPGVYVTVFNSTFEGCLGRYGGGAIFACGADISDSIFDSNEATGLFGAVVNGDLSDEIRANASLSLGVAGENYTCPPLFVSSTFFESNVAATGYGGAIASVDSSLSVFNTSVLSTLGGGIYFGTSSSDGRDQLELELVVFNYNDGSYSSPNFFGAAFLLERTGSPASNVTGPLEQIDPPTSTSSVAVQSVGASSSGLVGTATDIYCFDNSPYECEGYFGGTDEGDIDLQLGGTVRCSACKAQAFTGIGSAAGAPTPAPIAFDDDDGLSKMGQERAQGGTPSPAEAGSGSGASSGELGLEAEDSEPELLGVTGGMRWVVFGLIVGLGGALLVCMCLVTVCRTRDKKRGDARGRLELIDGGGGTADENDVILGAATAGPRGMTSRTAANTRDPTGRLENGKRGGGTGGGSRNPFFAASPGTSVVADVNADAMADLSRSSSLRPPGGADLSRGGSSSRRPSGANLSRSSSRRPSETGSSRRPSGRIVGGGGGDRDPRRDTTDSAVAVVNDTTPFSSELKAREVARQRSIQAMATRDEDGWMSPPMVSAWGEEAAVSGTGHVAVSARHTPTKRGFAALPDDQNPSHWEEDASGRGRKSRGGSRERRPAVDGRDRPHHRDQSPPGVMKSSAQEAADAAAMVTMVPRGRQEERGRRSGGISASSRSAGRQSPPALDARSAAVAVNRGGSRSSERHRGQRQHQQQVQHQYPARSPPRHQQHQQHQRRRSPEAPTQAAVISASRNGGGSSHSRSRSRSRSPSRSRNPPRKIKPPQNGGGGGSEYGSPSKDGRGPGRAVKTPAGGARLPITSTGVTPGSVESSRGRRSGGSGSVRRSATDAAVARDGIGVRSQSARVVSSRQARDQDGRYGAVSHSPGRGGLTKSRSSKSRSSRGEKRGDGGFGGGGAGKAGGWTAELYRMSPGPKKDRSAQVYSGKFDGSRSDWSADGEVEWNRHDYREG